MSLRAVIDSIENQLSDVEVERAAETAVTELGRRLRERTRQRDEGHKTTREGES